MRTCGGRGKRLAAHLCAAVRGGEGAPLCGSGCAVKGSGGAHGRDLAKIVVVAPLLWLTCRSTREFARGIAMLQGDASVDMDPVQWLGPMATSKLCKQHGTSSQNSTFKALDWYHTET